MIPLIERADKSYGNGWGQRATAEKILKPYRKRSRGKSALQRKCFTAMAVLNNNMQASDYENKELQKWKAVNS